MNLSKFKLHYEDTPTDDLLRKIMNRTRSLKLKNIRGGYLAQIRVNSGGERKEVSEIAQSHREALKKLNQRMEERGIYGS